MVNIFDEDMINNLTPELVSKYYTEHHTEQDLADVYELVHEMWVYHEDCTYDYEEGTPEYDHAVQVFEQWNQLFRKLDEDIQKAMNINNPVAKWIDIETLAAFMERHGYENDGGWFVKKE